MTIIFLNPTDHKIYICSEGREMQVLDIDDPNIMDYIPNDNILYVKDGHILDRGQFADYLSGKKTLQSAPPSQYEDFDSGFRFNPQAQTSVQGAENPNDRIANAHKLYIHPKHNGTILIEDVQTQKFPDGVELNGKWDFLPIDEIGQDLLDESLHFRTLLAKGKIEIVNHDFFMKNRHKKRSASPTDAALDAIIIKDQRRGAARAIAYGGGVGEEQYGYNDVAVPIYVDG